MNRQRTFLLLLMLCSLLLARPFCAHAQTGFAYTGTLPNKPTGTYDFQFRLYSASSGGAQVGSTLSLSSVPVSSGSYSVSLNFGASSFGGSPLYLALSYRVHGTTPYTNLSGRVLQTTRFSILSANTLGIGGYPVSSAAPATNQALVWNGSAWTPGSGSGGGTTYSAGAGLALSGNVFSIASGGVIASMLASNSVTTAAIADGAVTTSA